MTFIAIVSFIFIIYAIRKKQTTPTVEEHPLKRTHYQIQMTSEPIGVIDYLFRMGMYDRMTSEDFRQIDPDSMSVYEWIPKYTFNPLPANIDYVDGKCYVFVEYGNRMELVGYVDDDRLADWYDELIHCEVEFGGGRGWKVYQSGDHNRIGSSEFEPYWATLYVSYRKTS